MKKRTQAKRVRAKPAVIKLKIAQERDGRWTMACPLRLWEVNGPDRKRVFRDGLHYFALYFEGGEYDHLITPRALNLTPPSNGSKGGE